MAVIKASWNDLMQLCRGVIREAELEELLDRIGAPLDDRDGDTLYIEVTPDRPDYLAVEGIAYALMTMAGNKPALDLSLKSSGITVSVEGVHTRPYIASLVARNVFFSEQALLCSMQLQEKMHDTFGRKRRKIAIGMHDLDKIKGNIIKYYAGNGNEEFIPLFESSKMSLKDVLLNTEKGREYAHLVIDDEYPLVCDGEGIIAFPPILNSERTKLSEATRNVFVDITGLDRKSVENAAAIIALALMMRGGQVQTVEIDYGTEKFNCPSMIDKAVEFSPQFANKLLGTKFNIREISKLLSKTGISIKKSGAKYLAYYPAWRVDILGNSDIAEEIAVAYGYNEFIPEKPELFTIGKETGGERNALRSIMLSLGFSEVNTFMLSNELEEFEAIGISKEGCVRIENPLTEEHTIVRRSLVPSMLRTIQNNKMHRLPLRLFEIGEVVDENGNNEWRLCASVYGEGASFDLISGVFCALCNEFKIKYHGEPITLPYLIKGRAARSAMRNGSYAVFGELNPSIIRRYGLEHPVAILEVSVKGF
ncbi:MAG: phenylalanine--tRNA ligase subunit beta [Candidatus Micrarchaeia archaeon]